ncbi:MAG: pitrilysin family protein [Clostridia bacterium]|nr:pitrilysin family protein [Clostridia bacterium]
MIFEKIYDEALREMVCKAKHPSGMDVIVIKKKGYSKKYATFSTKYGSINTDFVVPGEGEVTHVIDGVAHFLEHKVFEQPDGTNAFERFAKFGGNANAFTSFGVTNYLFSCTDNFYENLGVLLDYVQKPYFTQENVEKEKGIIAQEVRMYDDDPNQTVFYNCLKAMYKNHPVRVEIAGSVQEIMKTTPELLYKCYNTFYNPSNMALIIVGDVDEERVGKMAEEFITKSGNGEIKQIFPDEPKEIVESYIEAKRELSMPSFMLGYKDPETGGSGEELLRRDITSSIALELIAGHSSELYKKLYDAGDINWNFGISYDYETSFAFAAFSGDSADPKKVRDAIFAQVRAMAKTGVDIEALERCKKKMQGNMIRLLNSVEHLGNEYMFSYHRDVNLFDYPRICASVNAEDVNARISMLLDEKNAALSVVNPKG